MLVLNGYVHATECSIFDARVDRLRQIIVMAITTGLLPRNPHLVRIVLHTEDPSQLIPFLDRIDRQ